jgi:hypothetical protein
MSTLAATNLKNPSSGSNNVVLNTDGTTTIAAPSNIIKSGTAVASTSGTAIDFTSIPSWVKRVTVMFNQVSTNGTSVVQIQLGSGSVQTTGYISKISSTNNTSGFIVAGALAAAVRIGAMVITNISGNNWISGGNIEDGSVAYAHTGFVALSGTLDRIRITTVNGTDTFDAGSINILYEG